MQFLRFPQVSSSVPVTPLIETSSKPPSRPRTAPQMQTHEQPKRELNSKSAGLFQPNLQSVDENIETESLNTNTNVSPTTKFDIQRDVQILTLDDNDNKNQSQQITNEEIEQIPF